MCTLYDIKLYGMCEWPNLLIMHQKFYSRCEYSFEDLYRLSFQFFFIEQPVYWMCEGKGPMPRLLSYRVGGCLHHLRKVSSDWSSYAGMLWLWENYATLHWLQWYQYLHQLQISLSPWFNWKVWCLWNRLWNAQKYLYQANWMSKFCPRLHQMYCLFHSI